MHQSGHQQGYNSCSYTSAISDTTPIITHYHLQLTTLVGVPHSQPLLLLLIPLVPLPSTLSHSLPTDLSLVEKLLSAATLSSSLSVMLSAFTVALPKGLSRMVLTCPLATRQRTQQGMKSTLISSTQPKPSCTLQLHKTHEYSPTQIHANTPTRPLRTCSETPTLPYRITHHFNCVPSLLVLFCDEEDLLLPSRYCSWLKEQA